MSERIGIGILCFYGLDDVKTAVASVRRHTQVPYDLLVFDNSEDFEVGEWALDHGDGAAYVRSPYNTGCSRSRNRMCEFFAARGIEHFIVMDQDVEVVADGWAQDMLTVFGKHPDTGIVGWELANRTMGPHHARDATGVVIELPGMCNMYSVACMAATGGFCPEYFAYRFDTDFCLLAGTKGFKTRVVWPDTDKVRHNHPHQGVGRNPRMGAIRKQSQTIFNRRKKELGFANVGF